MGLGCTRVGFGRVALDGWPFRPVRRVSVVVVERFGIPDIARTLAERLAARRSAALNRGHHGNEWRTLAPACVRRKGSGGCLIHP